MVIGGYVAPGARASLRLQTTLPCVTVQAQPPPAILPPAFPPHPPGKVQYPLVTITVASLGTTGCSATATTTGTPAAPAVEAVPLFVTHIISVLTQVVEPEYVSLLLNWGLA